MKTVEEIIEGIDCSWYEDCVYYKQCEQLKETLKSVRGYFIVLENIIPIEMLSEGSGVFGAINDAKKEINEVLEDNEDENTDTL